jgi:integrase/recombinase XerC
MVTPLDIRDYRQYLQTVRRLKAATVNRKLAAISMWLDWALDTGLLLDVNPAKNVRGVRASRPTVKWLSRQDEGKILRVLERDLNAARTDPARRKALRNRALVVLILNTGLRASEALSLRLDDVEINARSGRVLVRSGKGNKERSVPLNKNARQALQNWLDVRPTGTPYVFTSQKGGQWSSAGARATLQEIARVAGVDAHLHTLRHTFAKRLVDAGVSLEKVAALLGHSRLDTTRIYTTPGESDLESAVGTLDY